MKEVFVPCPYCGEKVWGVNAGDLVNNLQIHFYDECAEAQNYL